MSKSQMKLANHAWRTETKALGWDKGWTRGRKAWKEFCRENARITVWAAEADQQPIQSQDDANERVSEELTEWTL